MGASGFPAAEWDLPVATQLGYPAYMSAEGWPMDEGMALGRVVRPSGGLSGLRWTWVAGRGFAWLKSAGLDMGGEAVERGVDMSARRWNEAEPRRWNEAEGSSSLRSCGHL